MKIKTSILAAMLAAGLSSGGAYAAMNNGGGGSGGASCQLCNTGIFGGASCGSSWFNGKKQCSIDMNCWVGGCSYTCSLSGDSCGVYGDTLNGGFSSPMY